MRSPAFYRNEDGSASWIGVGPLVWPTLSVYRGFWASGELRSALFSWYGLVRQDGPSDAVLVAWKPLVPFLRAGFWLEDKLFWWEYRFLLRPYLKLMGCYLAEGTYGWDAWAIRRKVWLGSWV